jgi:hypothetical protein
MNPLEGLLHGLSLALSPELLLAALIGALAVTIGLAINLTTSLLFLVLLSWDRPIAALFVEFCVEDPTRHQLLFQRTVPGFEPTAESYAAIVAFACSLILVKSVHTA